MSWLWIVALVLLAFAIDVGLSHYRQWREKRERIANAKKYGFVSYERAAKTKRL